MLTAEGFAGSHDHLRARITVMVPRSDPKGSGHFSIKKTTNLPGTAWTDLNGVGSFQAAVIRFQFSLRSERSPISTGHDDTKSVF